jgi:hypothetical protein
MSEDTYYQHVDFIPLKKESNKKLEISSMNNRPFAKKNLYFFLKVQLKISLNPKFQNFRVTC